MSNRLYYGDNLGVLRDYIADESIDLIYLDPPFNSKKTYNVLFKDEAGYADAQIAVFEDTWHWTEKTERVYVDLLKNAPGSIPDMLEGLLSFCSRSQMMAYLVMMTVRLVELHRVLRPTGSLYLHCDPTASHYLKVMLDTIFSPANFRNNLIWKRTFAHGGCKKYGPVHDDILFYSKTDKFTWTDLRKPHNAGYIDKHCNLVDSVTGQRFQATPLTGAGITRGGYSGKPWRGVDPTSTGRHWAVPGAALRKIGFEGGTTQEKLDALDAAGLIHWPQKEGGKPQLKSFADDTRARGMALPDIWTDIQRLSAQDRERLDFPTQKPVALLKRIIEASSNPGDVVLDPFCGCGTAIAAAEELGRAWIGIDITTLAIAVQRYRLANAFFDCQYEVIGLPTTAQDAKYLAQDDRFQFEWWALFLVRAKPTGGTAGSKKGKKGADRGVDGVINFVDEVKSKLKRVLIQVKSGKVSSRDIRDLRGAVEREKAAIGVFITLEPPTKPMRKEAVSAGFYRCTGWNQDFPKIQILTVDELLRGARVQMPGEQGTFRQAPRVKPMATQDRLI